MNEAAHLSEALDCYFSDIHNDWFTPLTEAIKNLNAEQAARVPAERFNSVWAVVNHIWVCEIRILLRLRNQTADIQALGVEEDWPLPVRPVDEKTWQIACQRMLDTHRDLVQTIANLQSEELRQPIDQGWPERWKVIQGVLAHNSYHTCEIISIRHMQKLWVEEV